MAYERKVKITSTLQGAYKQYKKDDGALAKTVYMAIAKDMLESISDMIIRESFEYKMPYRLGVLRVRKTKQKLRIKDGKIDMSRNVIDWKSTWEAWYKMYPGKTKREIVNIPDKGVIFQTNDHTDGHIMRWYWDKAICNIKNKTIYQFRPIKGGIKNGKHRGRLGLKDWIFNDDRTNDWFK